VARAPASKMVQDRASGRAEPLTLAAERSGTVGVDLTRNGKFNLALEYYGALGSVASCDPYAQQQHQLFVGLNVDFGPAWEFNAGVGNGWTAATDHVILKTILGRRLPS
jgi:hypothetical protein